jgi:pimeloyl-ACP methyl ester carboxylesterase
MRAEQMQIGNNRIAVYRSGGAGPSVLLIHGNSSSSLSYRNQLEGEFGRTHGVFALDLPGHGESARAAAPDIDYTLPGYASIVAGVSKALGLHGAIYVGWSLGGHILLEASTQLPDAAGLVIFGTPPVGAASAVDKAFLPNPAVGIGYLRDVTEEQAAAYADSFFRPGSKAPDSFREAVLRTDGRAREIMGASVGAGEFTDEERIVAELGVPLAIFHGAEEQLINGDYFAGLALPTLWRSKVQTIERAGHALQWEQPERFNALLAAFIAETKISK